MNNEDYKLLINHESWADMRIAEAFITAPIASGKSKKLLDHIIGAQCNWIARIKGETPELAIWPDLESNVWKMWIEKNHAALLEVCSDANDLSQRISYKNSSGQEFSNSISEIIMHLVLHSQYHRGQAIAYSRDAFDTPPITDMIMYLRTN